jgi:hypothetical protein
VHDFPPELIRDGVHRVRTEVDGGQRAHRRKTSDRRKVDAVLFLAGIVSILADFRRVESG